MPNPFPVNMRALKFFVLGMFLLGAAGCQSSDSPKDFPKTYSAKAIIKAGDTPLADATILLYAQNARGSWASSGNTDANGEAILVSSNPPTVALPNFPYRAKIRVIS